MLSMLNSLNSRKERLIEITADGTIEDSELRDFVRIQQELEKISASADSLRLWIDNKILSGTIDEKKLKALQKS